MSLARIRPLFVYGIIARRMQAVGSAAAAPRNVGRLCWHDSSISVWEERVEESSFLADVMGPLIRDMRARGWKIGPDPRITKHYASLKRYHRLCRLGDLQASIRIGGRHLEVELFQDVHNVKNRNGGRYDFDKLARMPYAMRMLAILELSRIAAFLHHQHGYPLAEQEATRADIGRPGISALDYIVDEYARSWHRDPKTGRPKGDDLTYNNRSADADVVRHRATVWARDRAGRWLRGVAFYALNNGWYFVTSALTIETRWSTELYVNRPDSSVGWRERDARLHRRRLEQEMKKAAGRLDFARAETLRRTLFGVSLPCRIWSNKQSAWYATQSQGYTQDTSQAGLFERDEAERLCRGADFLKVVPVTAEAGL